MNDKKEDCRYKKVNGTQKQCELKGYDFETDNSEINVCGNCGDYEK